MRIALLVLIISFPISGLFLQELNIYYDISSEKILYKVNDQVVSNPSIKRGQDVLLHIINYNNYLYNVDINVNSRTINFPSIESPSSIINLVSGASDFPLLDLLSFNAPSEYSNITKAVTDDDEQTGFGFANKDAKSDEIESLLTEFNLSMVSARALETELIEEGKLIGNEVAARKVISIAGQEIQGLKKNPNLPPETIRSLCLEYLQKVFNVESVEDVKLDYILKRSDVKSTLRNRLHSLIDRKDKYVEELNRIESIGSKISQISDPSIPTGEILDAMSSTFKRSQDIIQTTNEDEVKLKRVLNDLPEDDIQYLSALRYEFESLSKNSFTHIFRTQAEGDYLNFNVKLSSVDPTTGETTVLEKAPIELPVTGGLKINASFGLSFVSFGSSAEDYFLNNGTITSEENDNLIPSLSSFLHFYGQSARNVSLGGSIGVAFPISGNENITSLNFLFGPSILIGRENRVVISGGLMIGEVERLARGLQLGDSISDSGFIPTKKKYETGYFFGLSYNLGRK